MELLGMVGTVFLLIISQNRVYNCSDRRRCMWIVTRKGPQPAVFSLIVDKLMTFKGTLVDYVYVPIS